MKTISCNHIPDVRYYKKTTAVTLMQYISVTRKMILLEQPINSDTKTCSFNTN